MLQRTNEITPYFSPFYENNTVLLQLILDEFITSWHLISQMHLLAEKKQNSTSMPSLRFLHSFIDISHQLIGTTPFRERFSSLHKERGSLTKCKEYCEQLSKNSSHQNKRHFRMQIAVYETWGMAMRNFESFQQTLANPHRKKEKPTASIRSIFTSVSRLSLRFYQIGQSMGRVLSEYKDNENLMLFLFHRKNEWAKICSIDFFSKHCMTEESRARVMQWIHKRYHDRGFTTLPRLVHEVQSHKKELLANNAY